MPPRDLDLIDQIDLPADVWSIVSRYQSPEVMFGAAALHHGPGAARLIWDSSAEEVRDRMMRRHILRELYPADDSAELAYGRAFFAANGIDLTLD